MGKTLERALIGIIGIITGVGVTYSILSTAYQRNIKHLAYQEKSIARRNTIQNVYFSPQDNCSGHLIDIINKAKSSIYVEIYTFTEIGIADALVKAKKKGVGVKVLFDKKQASIKPSLDEYLEQAGVEIRFDAGKGIMHNKVLIVDNMIVTTGSFNFTNSANTRNNENLVVLEDRETAYSYLEEFEKLWQNSRTR